MASLLQSFTFQSLQGLRVTFYGIGGLLNELLAPFETHEAPKADK